MPKTTANGIKLHYLQAGKGRDLVLLHGLGGNQAIWHLQFVGRIKGRFRCTTYDLRGHGRSEMPTDGYTTLENAEDLRGLLDALGLEQPYIVAHSWGADIAMHFAILYPDRVKKMVVVEPNIAALIEWRKSQDWEGWAYWAMRLKEFGVDVPKERWHDVDYMLRQSTKIPIVYGPFKGQPRKQDWLIRLLDTTTLVKDYEKVAGMTLDKVEAIACPILALYGTKSHFRLTYDYLKDNVASCRAELIEGGDHYGPLENPDIMIGYILEFLGGNGADAPA